MKDHSEKVIEHLIEKWGENKKCPMCGHDKWNVNTTIFDLPEYTEDILHPESTFPAIPVTCNNCFTTQFLSAVLLGLVDGGEDKDE